MAVLGDLAEGFVNELRALRSECAALPATRAALTDPAAVILSDRYAIVQAAAAVLGIWEGQDGADAFLADPAWAVLALSRLAGRLGIVVPDLPESCLHQVLDELIRRYRGGLSCDLDGSELTQ
ncbi:hypothetical protein ACFXKW_19785 [Streptomyces sp. NPDC059193]